MSRAKPGIGLCFKKYKSPGVATVVVTILSNGSVGKARVAGAFANTPTGKCIEDALKIVWFSSFDEGPMTISYPFMLR